MQHSLGYEVLVWALGILSTIITSVLLPFFANWLKSKTNNENLKYVIDEFSHTAQVSVDYVNQTVVNQLKADGKFNEENQKAALELATKICLENLSQSVKNILDKNNVNIENLAKKYIESAVLNSKKK